MAILTTLHLMADLMSSKAAVTMCLQSLQTLTLYSLRLQQRIYPVEQLVLPVPDPSPLASENKVGCHGFAEVLDNIPGIHLAFTVLVVLSFWRCLSIENTDNHSLDKIG